MTLTRKRAKLWIAHLSFIELVVFSIGAAGASWLLQFSWWIAVPLCAYAALSSLHVVSIDPREPARLREYFGFVPLRPIILTNPVALPTISDAWGGSRKVDGVEISGQYFACDRPSAVAAWIAENLSSRKASA